MTEAEKPARRYYFNWLKGLYDIGPLAIGFFDGPRFMVCWHQIVRWEWPAR